MKRPKGRKAPTKRAPTRVPTPVKPKKKMPNRKRKNVTMTLSEEARRMGGTLAEERGIPFARLVEELLRRELRAVGLLKPEGFSGQTEGHPPQS